MTFPEFCQAVEKAKRGRPVLFSLASDSTPTDEEIARSETELNIVFPAEYKIFLKKYGGGYFGLSIVYSCDRRSRFFINNNVTTKWIAEHSFLPVVDFENGDLGGFLVQDGLCCNIIGIYNHDDCSVVSARVFCRPEVNVYCQ